MEEISVMRISDEMEDYIEKGWELSVGLYRCTVGPQGRPSFIRINPWTLAIVKRAVGVVA